MNKAKLIALGILGLILIVSGCLQAPKEEISTPPIPTTPTPTQTPTVITNLTPTPTPTQVLKALPPDLFYVSARMLKPSYWGPERYGLNKLKVEIYSQQEVPISFRAQIVGAGKVLEEREYTLERSGSSVSFVNEKPHFLSAPEVTLRIIVQGYKAKDFQFKEVAELG